MKALRTHGHTFRACHGARCLGTAGGDNRRGCGSLGQVFLAAGWADGPVESPMGLQVLRANPITSDGCDQSEPWGGSAAAQVGGMRLHCEPLSLDAQGGADTEQVALLPHGHARKLLHSQATEALCARPPPSPGPHPPKKQTEQLWCKISHTAHHARQTCCTKGSWCRNLECRVQRGGL